MSAKINLLPDLRQAKLQDKQHRQVAITIALISVVATAGLLLLGFLIIQGQNLRIKALTSSIADKKKEVAAKPDIKNILSTQGRLDHLPGLYSQRVYATELAKILSSAEPKDVAFSSLTVTTNKLTLGASGRSYLAAAKIARSLETVKDSSGTNYFTDVQLSAVSLAGNTSAFSISATINPGASDGK